MKKIFFWVLLVLSLSACGSNSKGGQRDSVYSVTANYSTLNLTHQDFSVVNDLRAFSDVTCENELVLQETISGEDQITYQFEKGNTSKTVYIIPPVISVVEKIEESTLGFQDETCANPNEFLIKDVSAQKEADSYVVSVVIASESGLYPNNLKMISGGKLYTGKLVVDISSSVADKLTISNYGFLFEIPSDETSASDILDNAHFTYSQISRFEVANDWNFSCEDTKLQIVNTTLG